VEGQADVIRNTLPPVRDKGTGTTKLSGIADFGRKEYVILEGSTPHKA